jgi:predicted RNA-binding protein YlqC (UPF0109 family)
MQDILEFVLKNITTVPEDVKIEVEEVEGTSNYIVTVNPADVGRIIGKEGKVIKAIRTIMRVIAIQRGVHIRISVVSENGQGQATETASVANEVETVGVDPKVEDDGSITVEV